MLLHYIHSAQDYTPRIRKNFPFTRLAVQDVRNSRGFKGQAFVDVGSFSQINRGCGVNLSGDENYNSPV